MFTQNTLENTNVQQSKQAEYLNVSLFLKKWICLNSAWGLIPKTWCRRQNTDLIKSMYVSEKCSENIQHLKQEKATVWTQSANSLLEDTGLDLCPKSLSDCYYCPLRLVLHPPPLCWAPIRTLQTQNDCCIPSKHNISHKCGYCGSMDRANFARHLHWRDSGKWGLTQNNVHRGQAARASYSFPNKHDFHMNSLLVSRWTER